MVEIKIVVILKCYSMCLIVSRCPMYSYLGGSVNDQLEWECSYQNVHTLIEVWRPQMRPTNVQFQFLWSLFWPLPSTSCMSIQMCFWCGKVLLLFPENHGSSRICSWVYRNHLSTSQSGSLFWPVMTSQIPLPDANHGAGIFTASFSLKNMTQLCR